MPVRGARNVEEDGRDPPEVHRDASISHSRPSSAAGQDIFGVLGDAGYRTLRALLVEGEGLDLDAYRATYLGRRLRARLIATGLTPAEYVDRVSNDAAERTALMEGLGVNVTAFFRDRPVWIFLEEVALPPLIAARAAAGKTLRAASLGCAGGQEPYSLGMVLSESTRDAGIDYRIDAFDLDPDALNVARAAVYPDVALDTLTTAARERYFEETAEGLWRVRASLRERVHVQRLNVLVDRLPATYDLITCRNVLIYVNGEAKDALITRLHEFIQPDGLLVLGQSEIITARRGGGFRALSPRHRVYRRAEAD